MSAAKETICTRCIHGAVCQHKEACLNLYKHVDDYTYSESHKRFSDYALDDSSKDIFDVEVKCKYYAIKLPVSREII